MVAKTVVFSTWSHCLSRLKKSNFKCQDLFKIIDISYHLSSFTKVYKLKHFSEFYLIIINYWFTMSMTCCWYIKYPSGKLNWIELIPRFWYILVDDGTPVLTLPLSGKTKQWNKIYETCQFCTQKPPKRCFLGIINVVLKKRKKYIFPSIWTTVAT